MDKPMLMFKRFGHQVHLMVQKEAKRCGIEFMGGPQGQVLRFLDHCEQKEELVLIKDIEQELNISKSVASNLVKRMVQNGLVELEASPSDKRAKFVPVRVCKHPKLLQYYIKHPPEGTSQKQVSSLRSNLSVKSENHPPRVDFHLGPLHILDSHSLKRVELEPDQSLNSLP